MFPGGCGSLPDGDLIPDGISVLEDLARPDRGRLLIATG
jgi:hypothetical protein